MNKLSPHYILMRMKLAWLATLDYYILVLKEKL